MKIKTRDKIIIKAIELFNDRGIQSISTKTLADECGINAGNLYYYFKTKEEILLEIFNRIVTDFDEVYKVEESPNEFSSIEVIIEKLFFSQKKYKFFYRDMFIIFSDFPNFKEIYTEKFQERIESIKGLFFHYIDRNYIKKEIVKDLEMIISMLWFNATFYNISHEVVKRDLDENCKEKENLVYFIYKTLDFYFTDLGREQWLKLYKK